MAIQLLNRITGATNNLVYLETSDTSATATASGYLTAQASVINSLTEGGFTWETNDCVMVAASDGISWCFINAAFTTLTPFASSILPVPESATNGLTAHAGGGQTLATPLPSAVNRVTTVASPGDSVVLPASAPGLTITVINRGANPMQVFGLGTDMINGETDTVGVSQLPNSVVLYTSAVAGLWESELVTGGYTNGNLPKWAYENAVTAHSGGGQTSAVLLTGYVNNVSTVAAEGDSVKLPPSFPGMVIILGNSGANAMQVFGSGTDTINGISTGTGVAQASNTVCIYECSASGAWFVNTNSLAVNINAGQSGLAGTLTSWPATAANGNLSLNANTNGAGNFTTTISTVSSIGQSQVISIPDGGIAGSNFIISNSAGTQNISTGNLAVLTGNLQAGSSGHAGTVSSFPGTAANGSLILAGVNAGGAFTTTISNGTMGQSTVYTLGDIGATTGGLAVATAAIRIKSVAAAAVAGGAAAQTVTDAFCTSSSNVIANWNDTTNAVEIKTVAAGSGSFVVTSTADPGASHLNYIIIK